MSREFRSQCKILKAQCLKAQPQISRLIAPIQFQMSALLLPPTIAPFLTPAPLSLPFQTANYSGHFRNPAYDLSMLGVSSKIATIAQPCLVIYPEPEKAQAENPLKSIDEKTDQGICMVTSISILFLKPELVSLCLLEIDDEFVPQLGATGKEGALCHQLQREEIRCQEE